MEDQRSVGLTKSKDGSIADTVIVELCIPNYSSHVVQVQRIVVRAKVRGKLEVLLTTVLLTRIGGILTLELQILQHSFIFLVGKLRAIGFERDLNSRQVGIDRLLVGIWEAPNTTWLRCFGPSGLPSNDVVCRCCEVLEEFKVGSKVDTAKNAWTSRIDEDAADCSSIFLCGRRPKTYDELTFSLGLKRKSVRFPVPAFGSL